MSSPKKVECPNCAKPVLWSSENPYRPFCSERCRLIDLGEWLTEKKVIPGGPESSIDKEGNDSDEEGNGE